MKIIIAESAWSHNARVNDQVGASGGDNVVTPVVRFAADHHSRHHIEHRLEQRQFDELGQGGDLSAGNLAPKCLARPGLLIRGGRARRVRSL